MSFQLVLIGVVTGAVFLLFSTGFTLLYGAFNVMNLAQGAIMTLGAFVGIVLDNRWNAPIELTIVAGAIGSGLICALLDAVILRPIAHRTASYHGGAGELTPIVATLAFGSVIIGLVTDRVQGASYSFRHAGWLEKPLNGNFSRLDLVIIMGATVFAAGLYLVINKTRAGARIRSVAEDPAMASALGVRPNLVSATTFFASGAMAGVTGVLVGIIDSNVNVTIGDNLLLYGIVIITVGGLGSLMGTAIAAIFIGLIQTISGNYLGATEVDLIVYGLLFVALVLRPSGLLGKSLLAEGVGRS